MRRSLNEDSLLVSPELDLYVIADGMGGHKAGEVASRMAVDTMRDYWQKVKADKAPSFLGPIESDISDLAKHLVNSIYFANIVIHEAQKRPEYRRMGSTVSALLVEKDRMWAANVGDSPVYLFDHGNLTQISEEHSLEAEQRNRGLIDSLGPSNPMIKNMLTRVLGLNEKVEVYISPFRPEPGDVFVMCSDGLTNYLSLKAIETVLKDFSMSLERKAGILIDEANLAGGGDNITVILLEIVEDGRWGKLRRFISKG